MHVCSLLPSATEIIGQLGLIDHLVAVSEECDRQPEVRRLPRVTRTSISRPDALTAGRQVYAVDGAAPECGRDAGLCAALGYRSVVT